MKKDKVLVVDDDESMRRMLEAILQEDYAVLTARSGEEALRKLSYHEIPVVLLDIRLPGICGIDVLDRIVAQNPDIQCLMISAVHDASVVVDCVKRGAYGYMTKELEYDLVRLRVRNAMTHARLKKAHDRKLQELAALEEQINQCDHHMKCERRCGKNAFSPSRMANGDLKMSDGHRIPDDSFPERTVQNAEETSILRFITLCMEGENLTDQERKVLSLILRCFSNKEIARSLSIKLTTVKAHLKNIFRELGVSSRSQAVSYLFQKGLRKILSTP